jgi:hypothetical protein
VEPKLRPRSEKSILNRQGLTNWTLHSQRFDVTDAGCGERLDDVADGLGSGSVHTYVQLPWDVDAAAPGAVEQVHQFLTGGLLARFRLAHAMLPFLRPGARVVLVAGNRPTGVPTLDDRHARKSLLRLLARTIEADTADAGVRTVVVGDPARRRRLPNSPCMAVRSTPGGCRSTPPTGRD